MTVPDTILFVRRLAEGALADDGYEPQTLWLLPIFLRSRVSYYNDVINRAKSDLADAWRVHGHLYKSREEFDASTFVDHIWRRHSPYWWGLNDVVGYIDVRACVRAVHIEAALFLTHKRPSRALRDRIYVHRRHETYELQGGETNERLQEETVGLVKALASDSRIRRRHLELEPWQRLVRHTNILRIMLDAMAADRARRQVSPE